MIFILPIERLASCPLLLGEFAPAKIWFLHESDLRSSSWLTNFPAQECNCCRQQRIWAASVAPPLIAVTNFLQTDDNLFRQY